MTKLNTSDDRMPTGIPAEQTSPFPKASGDAPKAPRGSSAERDVANDAEHTVEAVKASGADAVASVARTVASAADALEEKSPTAAKFVRGAADGAERFSQNLRDWKVSEIGASLTDFANSQPVAVAGIALVAGFMLASLAGGGSRRS